MEKRVVGAKGRHAGDGVIYLVQTDVSEMNLGVIGKVNIVISLTNSG